MIPRLRSWTLASEDLASALAIPVQSGDPPTEATTADMLYMLDEIGARAYLTPAQLDDLLQPYIALLSPKVSAVTEEGFELVAQLNSMLPPLEAATYHSELVRCITGQAEAAKAMEESLMFGSTTRASAAGACDNWKTSLAAIEELTRQTAP